MLNFALFIYRTGSFEQVATTGTLHIKGIPADFVIFKLNISVKDCTTADALMRRTDRTQVGCFDWW